MRRAVLPLLLIFVAACGSTPPTTGNPPPPPGPPGQPGRTLFASAPISQGGGTLKYAKAGDPLNGLTITVPAAAYPTATTWTVTTDSSVLPTLPGGFSQVGPTLVIGNGQDFAMVAYAATFDGTNTQESFADPNHPGMVRAMAFANGILDPVPLQTNATGTPDFFITAYALGVTADVPFRQINSRWAEFVVRRAGSDRYPNQYHLEDSISTSVIWSTVASTDTVWAAAPFALRHICTDCPEKAVPGTDLQLLHFWNQAGGAPLAGDTLPNPLPDGTSSYLSVLIADSPFDPAHGGFVDAQPLTVRYHKLTATAPPGMVPGVPITLTAHPGVLASFQSVYTWTFNDGGTPATATVIGDSTVTRTFPAAGPYAVFVSMADPVHAPLGFGSATATVGTGGPEDAWQFTSVSAPTIALPPGGIGQEADDTFIQGLFNGLAGKLQTTPQNSLFYLEYRGGCQSLVLEEFPPGQFAPVLSATPGILVGVMGSNCVTPDYVASLAMGTLGSGTLIASAVDIPMPESIVLPGGSINATMSGKTLQGTFTWRVRYSTGEGVYTFAFQATQILP